MKDRLLEKALKLGCSHALVVDSNLLLPPPLAAHLVSLQLDIVAEVSWSEQAERGLGVAQRVAFRLLQLVRADWRLLAQRTIGRRQRFLGAAAPARDLPGRSRERLHPAEQAGDRGRGVVQGHPQPQPRWRRPAFQRQGRCAGAFSLG